jgi:hypothetical protein
MHNITKEKALGLLDAGQPIKDSYVDGKIEIVISGSWDMDVTIENCIVESFRGNVTQFEKTVRFTNTHFKNCEFLYSYFIGGLIIEHCTFDSYLDFQAGGHNKPTHEIIIRNSDFNEFVNFFDCWYQGPISIIENRFHKGTNIGSEKQLITFDFPPTIKNNVGQLDIESEMT